MTAAEFVNLLGSKYSEVAMFSWEAPHIVERIIPAQMFDERKDDLLKLPNVNERACDGVLVVWFPFGQVNIRRGV